MPPENDLQVILLEKNQGSSQCICHLWCKKKGGKEYISVCTNLFLQKDILEKMAHKLMKIKIF